MFGLGKEEKSVKFLSGIIRGASLSFDNSLALTIALTGGEEVPPAGDRYLAILLGFADAAGQAEGVDMQVSKKALKTYLSKYPDGPEIFDRMMRLSNNREYFEWQMLGGRALVAAMQSGDKVAPMMQLATAYLK